MVCDTRSGSATRERIDFVVFVCQTSQTGNFVLEEHV